MNEWAECTEKKNIGKNVYLHIENIYLSITSPLKIVICKDMKINLPNLLKNNGVNKIEYRLRVQAETINTFFTLETLVYTQDQHSVKNLSLTLLN